MQSAKVKKVLQNRIQSKDTRTLLFCFFDGIYIADNLHKILVFVSVQRLGRFQLLFYGGQIYAERQGAVPRYL